MSANLSIDHLMYLINQHNGEDKVRAEIGMVESDELWKIIQQLAYAHHITDRGGWGRLYRTIVDIIHKRS